MNIALVDDSKTDIDFLYNAISQYCQEHKVHMQIDSFTNGVDFLQSFQRVPYNLVFLDIFMHSVSGLKIAQKLQTLNNKCQIIFTTSSKEHAINAFRLHVLDYLVKPYSYEILEDAMNRFEQISSGFSHYIEVKEGRHQTKIYVSDIIYIDYYNHYVQIHTASRMIRSYMSFDNFAPLLEPYAQFLWCYRNCMVNMDYVESLDDKDFLLKTGERLPISKSGFKSVTQNYADYLFNYVSGGGN